MGIFEKTFALSSYELRLIVRSTWTLAGVLALPIAGAVCFAVAGIATDCGVAPYGLYLVLLLSSLLTAQPAVCSSIVGSISSTCAGPSVQRVAGLTTMLAILVVQAALYVGLTAILHAESALTFGTTLVALAVSLSVGYAVQVLKSTRR